MVESVGPSPKVRQLHQTKLVLTCSARSNPAPEYSWVQYTPSGTLASLIRYCFSFNLCKGILNTIGLFLCINLNKIKMYKHLKIPYILKLPIFLWIRQTNKKPKLCRAWTLPQLEVKRTSHPLHVVIDQRLQQQQHQLDLFNCTVGMVVRGSGPDLVIDHLQYSDEGSYECRASNIIAGIKKQTKSKYLEVFFSNFFWWFFRLNFHRQVGALLFFLLQTCCYKKKKDF